MTRICMVVNPEFCMTYTIDDPRPMRELVKLINTRKMVVGKGEMNMDGERQNAIPLTSVNVVLVLLENPPVELTPRHYDVLYGLADSKPARQIAEELGIGRRTVYEYIEDLKLRLEANSKWQIVAKAIDLHIL